MDDQQKKASSFLGLSGGGFNRLLSVVLAGCGLLLIFLSIFGGDKRQSGNEVAKAPSPEKTHATMQPKLEPQPAVQTRQPSNPQPTPAQTAKPAPQWILDEKGATETLTRQPAGEVEYDDFALGSLSKPQIVIEKSKLRLTVFDGQKPVKRYRSAVGGGRGDKTREGDHCTPEGMFYVCVRNTRSRYVLSLGLSYPNIEDAERGLQAGLISQREYDQIVFAIRRGQQPPWNTKLGGEIMIHGKRNGGRDTKGCIALEDDDIRELFPKIPVGTKVTILP